MDLAHLRRLGLPLVGSATAAAPTAAQLQPATAPAEAAVEAPPAAPDWANELIKEMLRPLRPREDFCQVSVVSFNMLLRGFEEDPYEAVPAALCAWAARRPRLRQLLSSVDADVYCMQEVQVGSFEEDFAFLKAAGYAAVEPRDPKGGNKSTIAKCAIFYKANRLELVWREHRSRVVLAALKHVSSGRLFYVVNCHLEGAPWKAAARFNQIKSALDRLHADQHSRGLDPETCPLFVLGDFNCCEDSAVCHCLRSGSLPASFRDPWAPDDEITATDYKHQYGLDDLYGDRVMGSTGGDSSRLPTFCAPLDDQEPTFTAIDYVFFSHRSLRPVAVRKPFTNRQLAATEGVGIPSHWHFSDHVPVGGIFEFRSTDRAADPGGGQITTDVDML